MYKLQIILPKETIIGPEYKSLKTVVQHAEKALKNIKEDTFPEGISNLGYFSNSRMYFFSPAWNGLRGTQSFSWIDNTGRTKFEGQLKILEV